MAVIDSRSAGVLPPLETPHLNPDDKLRKWLSQLTGLPLASVRKRWQPKPGTRPSISDDWCAVGVERIESQGIPQHVGRRGQLDHPESGDVVTVTHQTIVCLASFYGPNSMGLADRFREGAQIGQNVRELAKEGLLLQSIEADVLHLPDFLMNQWVDRYEVRFAVGRVVERTYGVRSLASVGDIQIFIDKDKGTL